MISRGRLLIVLARPAVVFLAVMYGVIGMAQGGHGEDKGALLKMLAVVAAFLVFSLACNDLADEAIDRVNLPDESSRPLVTGSAGRRDLVATAMMSAVVAVTVSAWVHWAAAIFVTATLALSAAYSMGPIRLSGRGILAPLALPAGFVAMPYVVGLLAVGTFHRGDLALLGGLYVVFIGRIVLKDFRDVRGDRLFGKRTFLVRHGRAATCRLAAVCWVGGTTMVLATVRHPTVALVVVNAIGVLAILGLLVRLSRDEGHRRDEAVIAAIAGVGRWLGVLLFAHLSMTNALWPAGRYGAVVVALTVVAAGQVRRVFRDGPRTRATAARLADDQLAEMPA